MKEGGEERQSVHWAKERGREWWWRAGVRRFVDSAVPGALALSVRFATACQRDGWLAFPVFLPWSRSGYSPGPDNNRDGAAESAARTMWRVLWPRHDRPRSLAACSRSFAVTADKKEFCAPDTRRENTERGPFHATRWAARRTRRPRVPTWIRTSLIAGRSFSVSHCCLFCRGIYDRYCSLESAYQRRTFSWRRRGFSLFLVFYMYLCLCRVNLPRARESLAWTWPLRCLEVFCFRREMLVSSLKVADTGFEASVAAACACEPSSYEYKRITCILIRI